MEEFWFTVMFRLRMYEASGEEFQRFFSDIMSATYGLRFQAIRPWGNLGDGGNDGYIPDASHYYQLYSPGADAVHNPRHAAEKCREDFAQLLLSYPELLHYTFVYNDRFENVPAPVAIAVEAIARAFDVQTDVYDSRKLALTFHSLAREAKIAILLSYPVEAPTWVDPRSLAELLRYLASHTVPLSSLLQRGVAPEFDRKIEFNHLCPAFADMLRASNYLAGAIDAFFQEEPGLAQCIAQEVREIYSKSKELIPETDENAPDVRFVYILQSMLPPGVNMERVPALQGQAIVIMSKYFEACDVYEEPPV